MKKQNSQNISLQVTKKLSLKIGFGCIVGALLSIILSIFTSLDDICAPIFFVLFFSGIILIFLSGKRSNDVRINKWISGDTIDPTNPFNTDRR